MGWFSSIFGSSNPSDDTLSKLDPKLREFLDKESPVKLQTTATKSKSSPAPSPRQAEQKPRGELSKAAVPKESQFQDGRYAHIWKNYRPLDAMEGETKTGQDQLMDVLEGYKERKHLIGKAALENCALQQEAWRKCMTGSGSWTDTLTMCSDQVREFEKCYTMQSRFLRVLGYKAQLGRDPLVEEDVQMHADMLYQRMVAHEEAAAQAKKEGRPIPAFQVVPPSVQLPPDPGVEIRQVWKERLDSLPPEEREAEEAALRADYAAKSGTVKNMKGIWDKEDKERVERKQQGKATALDRFWLWRRSIDASKGGGGKEGDQ